jgi:hypothetical protein
MDSMMVRDITQRTTEQSIKSEQFTNIFSHIILVICQTPI